MIEKKIRTDKELAKLANVGIGTIARLNRVMSSDDEVMEWMLDIQLGRRNLSPIQWIAVTEKHRPIYERQAKENQKSGGGDKKNGFGKFTKSDQSNKHFRKTCSHCRCF